MGVRSSLVGMTAVHALLTGLTTGLGFIAALGAMLASTLWFAGIGFGARAASSLLDQPRTWRILDGLVALVMLAVAARLAFA